MSPAGFVGPLRTTHKCKTIFLMKGCHLQFSLTFFDKNRGKFSTSYKKHGFQHTEYRIRYENPDFFSSKPGIKEIYKRNVK